MNNPLISICIPAYNAAPFIKETLSYFQNQNYNNLEIIVQDDCSLDDTYALAEEIGKKDARVKVYQNAKNLGIGENWNITYKKAQGEFVVIANADDIHYPEMIKKALNIFKEYPTLDSVSFKYLLYDETSGKNIDLMVHNNLALGKQLNLFERSFFENPFSVVFTIFKKASLNKILVENQLFLNTQICDAELFFRIGKHNFNHYFSDYVAGKYRKHLTNNSYIKNGESYSWLYDVLPVYREYLLINYRQRTMLLLKNKILHQFKYSIKNLKPFDVKQICRLIKEYKYFNKKHV